jgi:hypothetical protein
MYLETLIELGIVGFAIFLSVLAAIIASAREAARRVDKALGPGTSSPNGLYYAQLGKALKVWFAACAIFSLAHYGLSSYAWYLFAGLMVAYSRVVAQSTAVPGTAAVLPEETPRGRGRNGRRARVPGR